MIGEAPHYKVVSTCTDLSHIELDICIKSNLGESCIKTLFVYIFGIAHMNVLSGYHTSTFPLSSDQSVVCTVADT